jgi:hypothetical protein
MVEEFIPPSPSLVHFYVVASRCILFVAIFAFLVGFFVVYRKSTVAMGKYKWLLLREIIWNGAFDGKEVY